jgi:hypothetical protein
MTDDRLPVLVEDDVWPEFVDAVRSLGERWTSPDGTTTYDLRFDAAARRLEVFGPDDDGQLLELAKAVHDAAGGIWSGDAVHHTAALWTG